MKKIYGILFLTSVLALGSAVTARADEREKIETVQVKITCNPIPEAGEKIEAVTADTSSLEFIVSGAEYENDADEWVLGDEPVVLVELEAKSGYKFSYTSRSHFDISGEAGAEFKKARVYDSGDTLELQVELDQITGKLGPVEDVEWDGRFASWDDLDGAKSYEVRLYRNGSAVRTYTTSKTYYDFAGKYTRPGDYSVRVRGVADYNSRAGEWSDLSEEYYISRSEIDWNYDDRYPSRDDWYDWYGGDRWEQNSSGWRYRFANGTYAYSCWQEIGGERYYFDGSGYMQTGWEQVNGNWYYLDASGAMQTDWQYVNGRWYYLNHDGVMLTGWQDIGGTWYYLDASGAMLTGWQDIGGKRYYLDASGAMLTGWQQVNGSWYFMEGSGAMLTGWQNINEKWYLLNSSGVMQTGWQESNGKWYYLDASGAMLTGWQYIGDHWYFMEGSGAMLTGWQNINEKWYYLEENGVLYQGGWTPDGHLVDGNGVYTGQKR